MQMPCININGTAKETLRADLAAALSSADTLVKALQIMAPHGRDYPIAGTYAIAREEHAERIEAARQIQEILQTYAIEFCTMLRNRELGSHN